MSKFILFRVSSGVVDTFFSFFSLNSTSKRSFLAPFPLFISRKNECKIIKVQTDKKKESD